jgi:hypothetical protein
MTVAGASAAGYEDAWDAKEAIGAIIWGICASVPCRPVPKLTYSNGSSRPPVGVDRSAFIAAIGLVLLVGTNFFGLNGLRQSRHLVYTRQKTWESAIGVCALVV